MPKLLASHQTCHCNSFLYHYQLDPSYAGYAMPYSEYKQEAAVQEHAAQEPIV